MAPATLYQPRLRAGQHHAQLPFLFAKAQADKGDVVVNLPALTAGRRVVVARPGRRLARLQSLDRSYPVLAAGMTPKWNLPAAGARTPELREGTPGCRGFVIEAPAAALSSSA